ncbi:hypothetical protein KS4_32570 [Poriferisphaera corsica]|uniref:Alpha/beta hydrolase n=1 Tax=Poriferisphaera corsica TaxID=2528020 RepID=A0A517YY95_9BACT|nr:hypothetical protein [Poriferisphaera corsica]QDU35177.1 hypothetical protein KS4_32570 [Poriferisphaera corsica]
MADQVFYKGSRRGAYAILFFVLCVMVSGMTWGKGVVSDVGELSGFKESRYFDERIREYVFDPNVKVHINAPSAKSFGGGKPVRVVIYALPNGNTTAQTIGRQRAEGVDWHFFIQHIGAQVRRLREVNLKETIVVAYVEAGGKSWPHWRRTQKDADQRIKVLIEEIRALFGEKVRVDLAAHSGGGSFMFGFINAYEAIPDWVGRMVWLDANYGYSDALGHGEKLLGWLERSREHYLGVVAYDDRDVEINGKKIVGPTGGTYRATHRMIGRIEKDIYLQPKKVDAVLRYRGLKGQVDINLIENSKRKILHTVLVERNGLIHGMTFGTDLEGRSGQLWGKAAYEKWIQEE